MYDPFHTPLPHPTPNTQQQQQKKMSAQRYIYQEKKKEKKKRLQTTPKYVDPKNCTRTFFLTPETERN